MALGDRARRANEREGIHRLGLVVEGEMGWILREQPVSDYGIDAEIEIHEQGLSPSGRLIAAQVKSGQSYLDERTDRGFVFRSEDRHLGYWLSHSLPVIIVLHDPRNHSLYWQVVDRTTVERLKVGWKLFAPNRNVLSTESSGSLSRIAEGPLLVRRLRRLSLAKPWIELVDAGERLILEADEWVNKTSGRGSLRLIAVDETGAEEPVLEWPFMWLASKSYDMAFQELFPWANLEIDDEHYETYDEADWHDNFGAWDSENGTYILHTMEFGEFRERLPRIRPYEVAAGEVARYRLVLSLNDLGRAFLVLDPYLSDSKKSLLDIAPYE